MHRSKMQLAKELSAMKKLVIKQGLEIERLQKENIQAKADEGVMQLRSLKRKWARDRALAELTDLKKR